MELSSLVEQVRNHYVEQFRVFAEEQRKGCIQGGSEVKLQLSTESRIYRSLYCADFIKNDEEREGPQIAELLPDSFLDFPPFSIELDDGMLVVDHMRWNDIVISHDVSDVPLTEIDGWFCRWFDPEDMRYVEDAPFSDNIHSLMIEPYLLSVDFGTAQGAAFTDLLDLLVRAGARNVRISYSGAEDESD
jgi:hypothetical protein